MIPCTTFLSNGLTVAEFSEVLLIRVTDQIVETITREELKDVYDYLKTRWHSLRDNLANTEHPRRYVEDATDEIFKISTALNSIDSIFYYDDIS